MPICALSDARALHESFSIHQVLLLSYEKSDVSGIYLPAFAIICAGGSLKVSSCPVVSSVLRIVDVADRFSMRIPRGPVTLWITSLQSPLLAITTSRFSHNGTVRWKNEKGRRITIGARGNPACRRITLSDRRIDTY